MNSTQLETLFQALNQANVKYAIVGGLAVNLHGYQRFTKDVDLIINLQPEEVEVTTEVLQQLDFRPIYPVTLKDFNNSSLREEWVAERNMTVFSVVSDTLRGITIDLFVTPPYDYAEIKKDLYFADITESLSVPVIDLDRLIRMKEDIGRVQDKADAEQLKKLREEYHRENPSEAP